MLPGMSVLQRSTRDRIAFMRVCVVCHIQTSVVGVWLSAQRDSTMYTWMCTSATDGYCKASSGHMQCVTVQVRRSGSTVVSHHSVARVGVASCSAACVPVAAFVAHMSLAHPPDARAPRGRGGEVFFAERLVAECPGEVGGHARFLAAGLPNPDLGGCAQGFGLCAVRGQTTVGTSLASGIGDPHL
jgi:hypothetical protein